MILTYKPYSEITKEDVYNFVDSAKYYGDSIKEIIKTSNRDFTVIFSSKDYPDIITKWFIYGDEMSGVESWIEEDWKEYLNAIGCFEFLRNNRYVK